MDLFENYNQLPEELQAVLNKWQQKEANIGLDYKDCKAFQEECEAVGYTFDYQLDAQPFDLRPISSDKQQISNVIDNHNTDNMLPTNENQAADLPKGWSWNDYDDGSGSLKSPSGKSYYGYDLQTQEYRLPYGKNEWTGMKDLSENQKSLNEFKIFAENDLKENAKLNLLSPKLSEQEINDLLGQKNRTKEKEFILEDLNINQQQRESYLEKMEFGTTNGDYSLTEQQLNLLPDLIDGHHLSKNDKYELAYGLLQKQQYAEAYSILPGGQIIKMYLDDDGTSLYRPLSINEVK